jgi:Domain of unknown function (DUF5666)
MKRSSIHLSVFYIIILMTISACGGGGGGTTADGGIGGTGISVGTIAGFGSVFVNGVEFSTTGAVITKNGNSSDENELRIGMVVAVHGTFDANGTTGAASRIDFNDDLEGPIQSLDLTAQSLVVMGQTVKVNTGTQFEGEGVTGFSNLQEGNVIEVSGLPQADGTILATYIELKSASYNSGDEIEVKGTIYQLDTSAKTFKIGALIVDYSSVSPENLPSGGLSDGLFIEVKSSTGLVGGVLIASQVKLEDSGIHSSAGTEVKLEGFVTRFVSAGEFDVNGQPVSATDETVFEHGTQAGLALNVRLEVEGTLNDKGVLIAQQISLENEDGGSATED